MDKTLPEQREALKKVNRGIGDLFLTCRQMRYLADAAGDTEAVKAWDATGNHLAEALLAADRAGPCAICDRRTDVRCPQCDTLLCADACRDMWHTAEERGRQCQWFRVLKTYPEARRPW